MDRIVGLDVGDKRIGIAVSDPMQWTAQGLETYTRKEDDVQRDAQYIAGVISSYQAKKVVCGFPKNMNGTVGPQAEKVKAFMEEVLKYAEVEVIYWDERLTTVSAHRTLIEADMSRKKTKKVVDKLAAVYILQSYLDFK